MFSKSLAEENTAAATPEMELPSMRQKRKGKKHEATLVTYGTKRAKSTPHVSVLISPQPSLYSSPDLVPKTKNEAEVQNSAATDCNDDNAEHTTLSTATCTSIRRKKKSISVVRPDSDEIVSFYSSGSLAGMSLQSKTVP
jgi:hypothetical protein